MRMKTTIAGIAACLLITAVQGYSEVIDMSKYDLEKIVKKNCKDISTLKKAVTKLIMEMKKEESIWKKRAGTPLVPLKEDKVSKNCKIVTKVFIDKDQIKYSYKKFKEPKTFTVASSKAYIYDYPALLGTKKVGMLKRGEKFVADMFTYPGWVHYPGKGWLRGFKLKPKVLYMKDKVNKSKEKSAYVYVKEKVCTKVDSPKPNK